PRGRTPRSRRPSPPSTDHLGTRGRSRRCQPRSSRSLDPRPCTSSETLLVDLVDSCPEDQSGGFIESVCLAKVVHVLCPVLSRGSLCGVGSCSVFVVCGYDH